MTDDDVILQCKAMDLMPELKVYSLAATRYSVALRYSVLPWNSMDEGEKMVMVRSGNFFFSAEDAEAARVRMLVPSEEKALILLEYLLKVGTK